MKSKSWTTPLMLMVGLSALASVLLCLQEISYTREFRSLQRQTLLINNRRQVMNALATDLVQYGRQNPAILPLLQSVGVKIRTNSAPVSPVQ